MQTETMRKDRTPAVWGVCVLLVIISLECLWFFFNRRRAEGGSGFKAGTKTGHRGL